MFCFNIKRFTFEIPLLVVKSITLPVNKLYSDPKIIDIIAPEHLHLQNESKDTIFSEIQNAGEVFLGEYSSEAFGDYIVGTNHVLPTFGSAKFSSGLGVLDFMKRTSYIKMNEKSYSELENNVSQKTIDSLRNIKMDMYNKNKKDIVRLFVDSLRGGGLYTDVF